MLLKLIPLKAWDKLNKQKPVVIYDGRAFSNRNVFSLHIAENVFANGVHNFFLPDVAGTEFTRAAFIIDGKRGSVRHENRAVLSIRNKVQARNQAVSLAAVPD